MPSSFSFSRWKLILKKHSKTQKTIGSQIKFRRQSLLHKMISYEDNADWKELKSSCIFFHLIEVTRKWSQDPEDIQHTTYSTYHFWKRRSSKVNHFRGETHLRKRNEDSQCCILTTYLDKVFLFLVSSCKMFTFLKKSFPWKNLISIL